MRALLDTSVLIADAAPTEVEAAISVVSITELHFGTLLARNDEERARRTDRLVGPVVVHPRAGGDAVVRAVGPARHPEGGAR